MYAAYKRWCLKQASTAQCSPALMVAACLAGIAFMAYFYWGVIVDTFLAAIAVTLTAATISFIVFIAVKVTRAERTARAIAPVTSEVLESWIEAETKAAGWPSDAGWKPGSILSDTKPNETVASMKATADQLADDSLELLWTADGKSLVGKKS